MSTHQSIEVFGRESMSPESSAVAIFEHCRGLVQRGPYPTQLRRMLHEPAAERRPWRRMPPDTVAEVLQLPRQGLTQQQVADRVQYSQNKVGQVARANGIAVGKGARQRSDWPARLEAQS